MDTFLKAVWNKIKSKASWISEKLTEVPEIGLHIVTGGIAKVGGWINLGSHNYINLVDSGTGKVSAVLVDSAMVIFRAFYHTLVWTRKVFMFQLVVVHNLVSTLGLLLQSPYLALVSIPLLKESWTTQTRTILFLDGMRHRVVVAEVTLDHYRQLKETRTESVQVETPVVEFKKTHQSKGRPTPKQKRPLNPTQVFRERSIAAGLA